MNRIDSNKHHMHIFIFDVTCFGILGNKLYFEIGINNRYDYEKSIITS